MISEIGPFQFWRVLVAITATTVVVMATFVAIAFLTGAFK